MFAILLTAFKSEVCEWERWLWVMVLAKLSHLISVIGTHVVEGENQLQQVVL